MQIAATISRKMILNITLTRKPRLDIIIFNKGKMTTNAITAIIITDIIGIIKSDKFLSVKPSPYGLLIL